MNRVLFTIGYEGKSVETYLDQLTAKRIKLLCDVRKNPISRKSGFSKRALCQRAQERGIGYVHLPELGIASSLRRNIRNEVERKRIFRYYRTEILPKQRAPMAKLLELLNTRKRVAITCFEANADHCHRSHLAKALQKIAKQELRVCDI